jgi:hypothetical protein
MNLSSEPVKQQDWIVPVVVRVWFLKKSISLSKEPARNADFQTPLDFSATLE